MECISADGRPGHTLGTLVGCAACRAYVNEAHKQLAGDQRKKPYQKPDFDTELEPNAVFNELALALVPDVTVVLKAVAYGAALSITSGTFGYCSTLKLGAREAQAVDQQLTKCIMDLAAAWERA